MPPPTQTAVPSPSPAATQTPLALPSDATQRLALPAVTPTLPAEASQPPSPPTALSPSPSVLGATLGAPETTASKRDGVSQSEVASDGMPSPTPIFLYRERRAAQSFEAAEGVAAAADEGDDPWPTALILGIAAPAAAAAAAACFVWQRWKKRARPP
jgi:hypothetical protein